MIELMCDCPELQDGHIYRIGDYVYDKGMMHIFSWGSGGEGPRQGGGYIWCQCADKLQRIPTRKELVHFAKLKKRRENRHYAKKNMRYAALEEDCIINWYGGEVIFLLDRFRINTFCQMMYWIKNKEGTVSIHHSKESRKAGWWHAPYPPMTYFYTWMPTQKQIQQRLMKKWWSCTDHYVRIEFHKWYNETNLIRDAWKLTGDEAWIAFYMYRVHNKVWKFKTKKKQWKEI